MDIINPPIVFGLHGDWGIGKSTFMNLLTKELEENKNNITIRINPWEYKDGTDIVSLFFIELYKRLKEKSFIEKLKDGFDQLFELIYPLKIKFNNFEYDVSKIKDIEKANLLDRYVNDNHLKKENIKLLFEKTFLKDYKVIVFIDDLDRCSVDKVIDILEAVKLFLNTNRCIFFLGCDVNYLTSAVANHYEQFININSNKNDMEKKNNIYDNKNSINKFTKEYLEKIIQVPFHIPSIDKNSMELYIDSIIDGKNENEDDMKDLYSVLNMKGQKFKSDIPKKLVKELFAKRTINPRRIKRVLNIIYLNYLFLIAKMKSISEKDISILVLLAIINDENQNFYKDKLSSKEVCIDTFNEKFSFINKADEEINGLEHTDEQEHIIESLFDVFFNYTRIKSEKDILKYMVNITNILTVSNTTNIITEYKNNWGKIGEIESISKTKRKVKTFLNNVDSDIALDFILWYLKDIFMPAYNNGKLQIGIYNNNSLLIFKSTDYKVMDFNQNYLIKFNYDSQNKFLRLILDTGKYTSRLNKKIIKQNILIQSENSENVKAALKKEFEGVL